jgi:hypothetical protein
MDTKTTILAIAGASIAIIMVLIICLMRVADHADKLEERLLEEEGHYGKD